MQIHNLADAKTLVRRMAAAEKLLREFKRKLGPCLDFEWHHNVHGSYIMVNYCTKADPYTGRSCSIEYPEV